MREDSATLVGTGLHDAADAVSPHKQPDRWPWPADTALDRARRVAQLYRVSLAAVDPERCETLDQQVARFGQGWAVPSVSTHEDDDLLTAELAADAVHVKTRTIYAWRQDGLPVVATPDGPRYRVRDIREFIAERRRRRT